MICSLIDDPEDLTNFRCASKAFAEYGLPAALREITIYTHGYHLDQLCELANHPIKSKLVKSIVFMPYTVTNQRPRLHRDISRRIRSEYESHPSNPLRKFYPTAPRRRTILELVDEHDISQALHEALPKFSGLRSVSVQQLTGLLHTLKHYPRPSETVIRNKPFHWDLEKSRYLSTHRDWKDDHVLTTCVNSRDYIKKRAMFIGVRFDLPTILRCVGQLRSLTFGPITTQMLADVAEFCKGDPSLLSGLREIRLEFCLGVMGRYDHDSKREEVLKGDLRRFLTTMPNLRAISVIFSAHLPLVRLEEAVRKPIAAFGEIFKPGHKWPFLREVSMAGIALDRSWIDFLSVHSRMLKGIELFSFCLGPEYEVAVAGNDGVEDGGEAVDHELVPKFLADMQKCMSGIERVLVYGWASHPSAAFADPFTPSVEWYLGTPWEANQLREDLSSYMVHGGDRCPLTMDNHWWADNTH